MQTQDISALAASISAATALMNALLALFIWVRTRRSDSYQLRATVRLDFQRMLLESSTKLIDKPKLWAIYDQNWGELGYKIGDDKELDGSLKALAYLYLNMFEVICSYYMDDPRQLCPVANSCR